MPFQLALFDNPCPEKVRNSTLGHLDKGDTSYRSSVKHTLAPVWTNRGDESTLFVKS